MSDKKISTTFSPEGYPINLAAVDELPDTFRTPLNPVEALLTRLIIQAVEEPIRIAVKKSQGKGLKAKRPVT
ncbi:hypothetical protein A3H89_01775 [Candidatus Amesbacteria bacterium RIFCSPLOWO2_02_FULL_48_11]|uniref:Uncharacterized protein n=1 Tax=Candidatus Amesbacteria bacterium RIFCSPHIGHO2_12_FULL_48_14 TaxID=1797257 RepID=A0A1F4Z4V6_9BACT|nr:MAG: hypothetical protein A2V48_04205 [Candidatus Amesbacteria bacterium RBG_19FT_COMBO_48_16]OGC96553.1 MAG: hypothetical protein A3C34_02220 [Candidatus Amesbacteria bacterium RIFCSPHIGHO2_02_FULL_48_21]OGD01325.1 MAG: hypothetical protein A3E17_03040 [Candidatus Amesbacteria bacterium RIFCSPHIGHO2_12_FULL_48_14]OGD05745.1 MAG: hypothetical protein A3B58_03200 [Candidatus Amesbacteria bacterium RIFCSPLOWO2_01_FULL_48_50]OGD07217.1 MAG: hypothetical protein A3H89_01775 [Candidatus Amesbacte